MLRTKFASASMTMKMVSPRSLPRPSRSALLGVQSSESQ